MVFYSRVGGLKLVYKLDYIVDVLLWCFLFVLLALTQYL